MKDKGLTEMKKYFLLFLLFCGTLFGQTDRFERPMYRIGSDTLITGATIYIVHEQTGDSLLLTEHPTKAGVYYRNSVAYGSYKIYINDALTTTGYPFGISRARAVIEAWDSDGDSLIEAGSFEAGAIAATDLNSTLDLSGKSVTLAAGEVSAGELASTLDLSSKTITLPDSNITAPKILSNQIKNIHLQQSIVNLNNINHVLLENQTAPTTLDSFIVSLSAYSFVSPKVTLTNKNLWMAYVQRVESDTVVIGIATAGVGDSVKVDLLIIEN